MGYVRVAGDHGLPSARIALLKSEPLGVGTIGQENWPFPIPLRPENVRSQRHAVIHDDTDIPLDEHVVLLYRLSHFLALLFFCAACSDCLILRAVYQVKTSDQNEANLKAKLVMLTDAEHVG